MLYRNDVSSRVEIDFGAERDHRYDGTVILDPIPQSCILELDGYSFDLCSKDPEKVLADMRRHLWIAHEKDMRDLADVEMAEDFLEAAE